MPQNEIEKSVASAPRSSDLDGLDALQALDVGGIGLWTRDLAGDKDAGNSVLFEIFDIDPFHPLDFQTLLEKRVHADDQVLLIDALDAVVNPTGQGGINLGFRIVRQDLTQRWISIVGRCEFTGGAEERKATKITAVLRDVTEQRDTDMHNRMLINELNHRVKGMLSLVQSVAYQSFRRDAGTTGLFTDFQGRLRALGKAHDLLVERRFMGTFLEPLAERILRSCGAPFNRVVMDGFPLHLGSKQAITLSIVFHELCVNALKYGAFSVPSGQVKLSWWHNGQSDMVRIRWIESGGPIVIEPTQKGFGSRMIERAIALEFGGALTMEYAAEGVKCTLTIPFKSFDQQPNE